MAPRVSPTEGPVGSSSSGGDGEEEEVEISSATADICSEEEEEEETEPMEMENDGDGDSYADCPMATDDACCVHFCVENVIRELGWTNALDDDQLPQ